MFGNHGLFEGDITAAGAVTVSAPRRGISSEGSRTMPIGKEGRERKMKGSRLRRRREQQTVDNAKKTLKKSGKQ